MTIYTDCVNITCVINDKIVTAAVRGEPPYHDTELLYRRHPSVRPRSSVHPRPRSRQPRFGSSLDNAFWHFRSRGRPRGQHGMPTCASILSAVYRAGLRPAFIIIIIISIHYIDFIIHSYDLPPAYYTVSLTTSFFINLLMNQLLKLLLLNS